MGELESDAEDSEAGEKEQGLGGTCKGLQAAPFTGLKHNIC